VRHTVVVGRRQVVRQMPSSARHCGQIWVPWPGIQPRADDGAEAGLVGGVEPVQVEARSVVCRQGRVLQGGGVGSGEVGDPLKGGRCGGEHEVGGGGVVPGPHHLDQAGRGEVVGVSNAFEIGIEGLAGSEVDEGRQVGFGVVSQHLESPRCCTGWRGGFLGRD
jgi:hypothetical protein